MKKKKPAPAIDPVDLIARTNRGRVPQLLQRKFEAMAGDPFVFLRATAGLGHRAVDLAALPHVPVGWICGDLHLQNFGSFRGANRLVYFDLNDFDEAARLPVCLDLLRFLGSIFTAAPGLGLAKQPALGLARFALHAYAHALVRGKPFWLERDTAVGPISALLRQTQRRKRRDLLASRTHVVDGQRRVRIDGSRYLAVPARAAVRTQIAEALALLGRHFGDAHFFELRDVAFRVAGMGSLGIERYVALVRGKGDPGRNALVDFKHAVPSAASDAWPGYAQPPWHSEASRVVVVQDLCEAAAPAYLSPLHLGRMSVVARELQPVEDKVALPPLARNLPLFDETLDAMARLSAWAQLRSAGRHGAASVEELVDFGERIQAKPGVWIDAARAVDAANSRAYEKFQTAWRDGDPRLTGLAQSPTAKAAPSRASKAGRPKRRAG